MKRRKPEQDHRQSLSGTSEFILRPIAFIQSPYTERFGTPRQATVQEQVVGDGAQRGVIEFLAGESFEQALDGLEGFDYCWAICLMHLNEGWKPMVQPPRGERKKRGLFATRSPHRPNPISLSALRIVGVEGRKIEVMGLDLIDGTPVLDVKPYVPYADAFPEAKAGWLDALDDPFGPDFHPDLDEKKERLSDV